MSTKAIQTALDEALERDEDYAEECEVAGRRDEARSTRARVTRLRSALVELEAIRKAAAFVVSESQDVNGAVWAMTLLESIAKESP